MTSDSKPKAHGSLVPVATAYTSSKDFDKANELRLAPFSPPKVDDLFPADCPLGLNQKLSALSPEMRALVSQRDLPAARRDRIISIALRTIYPALDKNG